MRARFAPLVLIAVIALAACDGSGSGNDPSSPVPTSPVSSSGSVPPVTITHSGPPQPTQPTVPADVPATGPNLRKPGERPPVMPLEATQHTQDGAVAFAKFFIQTIDWGFATTSGAYMRHYYISSCVSCTAFADGIDKAKREAHRYSGGRLQVGSAKSLTNAGANSDVQAIVNITTFAEFDKDGRLVQGQAPERGVEFDVSLEWHSNGWFASDLSVSQ